MTADELADAGCFVSLTCHPEYGPERRWCAMMGHYMTPCWPQVTAYATTLDEALARGIETALAAYRPDEAKHAAIVVGEGIMPQLVPLHE